MAHPRYEKRGRPRKEAPAVDHEWQNTATVQANHERFAQEVRHRACFIVATNVLDSAELSDEELVTTHKEQSGVERGFRFLKDPLAPFLLCLPQEAGTDRRMKPDYGLVSVGLSVGRTSATYTVSRKGASHSQKRLNKPTATLTMQLSSFNVLRGLSSCMCMLPLSPPQSSYACCPFICRSWFSWVRLINTSTTFLSQAEECGIHHTNDCFRNVNVSKMLRQRGKVIHA